MKKSRNSLTSKIDPYKPFIGFPLEGFTLKAETMKTRKSFSMIFLCCLLSACSKSEDANMAPQLSYAQNLVTPFYTSGNSAPPSIEWFGDQGKFGLDSDVEGVSIDPQSGVVSWDRTLPLGTNLVEVLAFNNSGVSLATLQIENQFQGMFEGLFDTFITIDGEPVPLKLAFNADGSCSYEYFQASEEGNWEMDDDTLNASFFFAGDTNPLFMRAVVINTTEEAYIEGFIGTNLSIQENLSGFRTDLLQ